jgi:hypothetical protein
VARSRSLSTPVPCSTCGKSRGIPPFSCLFCRSETRPWSPRRWDFAVAFDRAQARIRQAAGGKLEVEESDPVQLAMARARHAAPALVNLVQALTLGTDPEELDARRGGVRIMAELATRQLAIVGLKSGEVVEHDLSERFQDAMQRFFGPPGDAPRVIEGEARRLDVPRGTEA